MSKQVSEESGWYVVGETRGWAVGGKDERES